MYQDATQPQVRQLATELFTDRHDFLFAIARRNAHTEADASEALQEAFASFIAKFDPERGAPSLAWLTPTPQTPVLAPAPRGPSRAPLRPRGQERGTGARLLPRGAALA